MSGLSVNFGLSVGQGNSSGNGFSRAFGLSFEGFFDLNALAIINSMKSVGAEPTESYANQINKTVTAMKAIGRWNNLLRFYDFAALSEVQGLIDWKTATTTLTKAGVVNFQSERGFTAAGTTADALQDTLNLSTAGVSTDAVAVGFYSRTATAQSTRIDWGASSGTSLLGRIRNATNQVQFRLNSSASVTSATTVSDASGYWSWMRNASNVCQILRNGVQHGADVAVTSQAAPNVTLNWLNGIVASNSSSQRQASLACVSSAAVSVSDELSFYSNVVLPLMQYHGANV